MAFAPAWQPLAAARCSPAAGPVGGKSFRPDHTPEPNPKLLKMDRLKHRADFLRCAHGVRRVATGVTLEATSTPEKFAKAETVRVGFTATRRIGAAVERNRAKRRLRAAAAALLPLYGRAGHDYVLVARAETLRRPFAKLKDDLAASLQALHARLARTEQPS